MTFLDVNIGYTFSGGAIDFFLFGILPGKEPWWIAILLGLVFAVIYYFLFRFMINKFNLMTPGREEDDAEEDEDAVEREQLILLTIFLKQWVDKKISQLRCLYYKTSCIC